MNAVKMPVLMEYLDGRENITASLGMDIRGYVQVSVLEKGKVIRELPVQKNLILNFGMENLAVNGVDSIVAMFTVAVAGSGTTPTTDDSGTTTAAQVGTTVTLAGGAFVYTNTATDAGKMIKFDAGGLDARIVTVTSPTVVEVHISQTVVATEFTTYRTNQAGLTTELKRTSTYLTGAANCSTTWASNVATHKRTYDFTAEVGSVTYNELGFSNTASVGNNLWSRILLGSGVSLIATQQLRVVYSVLVTYTPNTATSVDTTVITGWGTTTADAQIQQVLIQIVSSTGATANNVISPAFEGSIAGTTTLWTGNTAHNTFNTSGPARTTIADQANVHASYVALSFRRDKTATFAVGTANVSTIRTIGLCDGSGSQGLVLILDSAQTKDNLHTLAITWRITWSRTLA